MNYFGEMLQCLAVHIHWTGLDWTTELPKLEVLCYKQYFGTYLFMLNAIMWLILFISN